MNSRVFQERRKIPPILEKIYSLNQPFPDENPRRAETEVKFCFPSPKSWLRGNSGLLIPVSSSSMCKPMQTTKSCFVYEV